MTAAARIFVLALALYAVAAPAQNVALPDAEHVVLDNGVVLIVAERHDVPLIGIEVVIRGGAVSDPEGKAGLTSILAGALEKGDGGRGGQRLMPQLVTGDDDDAPRLAHEVTCRAGSRGWSRRRDR